MAAKKPAVTSQQVKTEAELEAQRGKLAKATQEKPAEAKTDDVTPKSTDKTEAKPKGKAHSTKPDTIDVKGVPYMKFALIAAEMEVAFQQVYQRSQREEDKGGMVSVRENGILYGRVSDIDVWRQDKIERAARTIQRAEEKAARAEASKKRKADKEAAAKAKEEAEVDTDADAES